MKNIFLVFTLLISVIGFGQANTNYTAIDSKMAKIPVKSTESTSAIANYINANFKTETEKARAAFYWAASNISYDVKSMLLENAMESSEKKISKTLKTRKGVCIDYAEVFNELCHKVGINSRIIEGYTQQFGKIATIAHAWCAAKIDNKWYVFDPTWGAGVVNNGVFVKKMNNLHFKTDPSTSIASHMPFDYLWQFLNYPVTNQEFIEGKTQINKSKKYFDFATEIKKYDSLSENDKLWSSRKRVEENGVKNKLIQDYLNNKKREQEVLTHNSAVDKLNSISTEYNQAVVYLNDFINYRNKKFKPTLSDFEINKMIQTPKESLEKCQKEINSIGAVGKDNLSSLSSLTKSIYDALEETEKHEKFVKEYLSKSKSARKSMFSKVSWMGIPLN